MWEVFGYGVVARGGVALCAEVTGGAIDGAVFLLFVREARRAGLPRGALRFRQVEFIGARWPQPDKRRHYQQAADRKHAILDSRSCQFTLLISY